MPEKNIKKEVSFLNKDFQSLRNSLIDFAKQYYPTTYRDFNESSVGMMFIEMAAYIGDVLSYYIDNTLKENLLLYAEEERNIIAIAQALGYKPKLSFPASVKLDVFQVVPATGTGVNIKPDLNYALLVEKNSEVASATDPTVVFRTLSDVNFKTGSPSSSIDLRDENVFETDDDNNPTFFLLKKTVDAVAGEIKTSEFAFGSPERFSKISLPDDNVIDILKAEDEDGNDWHHVPFLAQDTIFQEIENIAANDPELAQYSEQAPYLLKLLKTVRRFSSRVRGDRKVELQFGSGISSSPDELLVPNPTNIGSNVLGSISFVDNPVDPSNFLFTNTYGQAPANTTLTVIYTVGGGIESNVNSEDLTVVKNVTLKIDDTGLDSDLVTQAKNSLAFSNPDAATGGRDGDTVEEVRINALANFPTQQRAVTKEDYIARIYSMPSRFGSIAKAYIVQDDQLNGANQSVISRDSQGNIIAGLDKQVQTNRVPNPMALNLYLLGYDQDRKLTTLNDAVKENLKIFLGQYRMLTDALNIKNGFIINIKVKFEIIAFKNENKREAVLKCIDALKTHFDIDNWQFNEPIVLSEIQRVLFSVKGVQSVVSVEIENVFNEDDGYSGNIYNIDAALKDGIVYPSLDPSIFEIRFPDKDIEGRAL